MPAEIDTGGPRVLHCLERADCPITRAPPILSYLPPTAAATSRSTTAIRRPRRLRCSRRRGDSSLPLLLGPTSEPSSIVPGNDERNEFFRDAASVPAASSNDLGGAPRNRGDFLRRRRRISSAADSTTDDTEVSLGAEGSLRGVSGFEEIEREEITPIDDTRQRLSQRTATSTCERTRSPRDDRRDDARDAERRIAMRLFDGRVESGGEIPMIGKPPPGNSSQRERPRMGSLSEEPTRDDYETSEYCCAECARQWESECVCECPIDGRKSGPVNVTRERRIGRRQRLRVQSKGRSCIQLALILFLLAFGRNSFSFNYNSGGLIARSSGIGGALAIGTVALVVGAANAAPIVDLDAGVRAERSANLSHITGVSRKIQMYIKNRHLQILPDGSVNGSNDDTSEYTIFQRTSVSRGQLRIQGVATCLYLCMDSCGLLYGSREYTDDCVFNETLEQHNYNSYSSVRWSTAKKTLYLGLNRWGQPRRVQAKGHNLGRLSAYARVLTQVAPVERVEALQARMLGAQHNLRHHHNSHHHRNMQQSVCPSLPPQEKDGRDKFRCRKRKKRKKRKRHCNKGEKPGPLCELPEEHRGGNAETSGEGPPQSKRSCEGAASEELCRKQALDAPAKKRKSRIEPLKTSLRDKEKQQQQQRNKGGKEVKPKKTTNDGTRKANPAGPPEDDAKRPNGQGGTKRKRPLSRQKNGGAGPAARKKTPGRVTRTSVAPSPTPPGLTLPTSSWYPGASTTPPSWRRSKTAASPKNAVTTGDLLKSSHSRNGKALEAAGQDSLVPEASTEAEEHLSSFNDSAETSEETKSEESTLDDELAGSSAEYSTLMTTMDTTPPERTEDYTRATTPAMVGSAELEGETYEGSFQGPALGSASNSELERLAM